ncbi:metallophosphoesterase [uncultured Paludibaculum sp.]|uniref:metallophosphoesterase family protein n=1 Tax=uncultured Paludibaculum sp. TaxID=1765020 RepID=UPI002AAC192D|nr:metallophosphoesterase [uncultured Paludibaculum sp.]
MLRQAALILLLLCLPGRYSSFLFAEDKIVGGPYAVNVTGKSATIGWVVQSGEVKVGDARVVPVLRSEKVTMTGLKPGEPVKYTIPGGLTGTFKTAPAKPVAFEAVVFGDTRTRHDLHRKIVGAIEKINPDLVFHTGDLVTDGLDTEQWPRFFDIERTLLAKTAFYPVLGNHERNSRRFYEFFDVSTPYYSVDWGGAHFVLLNSDLGNSALSAQAREAFWSEQLRWLDEDLAKAQKAEFRFVVMHHPPFTAVKSRQSGNTPVKAMVPIFEKHRVTVVFSGHDHNYQHHLNNGVHYVVTGGGGAPLYPVDAPIEGTTIKVESTEHYVRLLCGPGSTKIEAIALDGRMLESFELKP